jgi:hypothetical protein
VYCPYQIKLAGAYSISGCLVLNHESSKVKAGERCACDDAHISPTDVKQLQCSKLWSFTPCCPTSSLFTYSTLLFLHPPLLQLFPTQHQSTTIMGMLSRECHGTIYSNLTIETRSQKQALADLPLHNRTSTLCPRRTRPSNRHPPHRRFRRSPTLRRECHQLEERRQGEIVAQQRREARWKQTCTRWHSCCVPGRPKKIPLRRKSWDGAKLKTGIDDCCCRHSAHLPRTMLRAVSRSTASRGTRNGNIWGSPRLSLGRCLREAMIV